MNPFSYSRVECFKSCPYKFKLSYIDKLDTLPSDDPTNALIIGSAMHLGIEQGLQAGIEHYKSQYYILSDEHYHEIMKFESLIPKVEKYINRKKAIFELEILTNIFKGYIDYVEKDGNNVKIYDFKYSNNVDRYLESAQLHLYKYFYELLHKGETVTELGFIFIPKIAIRQKKTETLADFRNRLTRELNHKEVQLVTVEYDKNKVENFLSDVEIIKSAKEFPKKESNLCRFCNFASFCQEGYEYDLIHKK